MNLAYGGQALIEGVLMRSQEGYAFTVRKPDKTLHKEYHPCVSLGKKIKFLGLPFIRGIADFCINICSILLPHYPIVECIHNCRLYFPMNRQMSESE